MLNRQKGYTSQKTIFCHFTQQDIIMPKQNCFDKPVFNNLIDLTI